MFPTYYDDYALLLMTFASLPSTLDGKGDLVGNQLPIHLARGRTQAVAAGRLSRQYQIKSECMN